MNIVVATDKFKGSLGSIAACNAIEKGLLHAAANFHIQKLPLSDGGDGLIEVVSQYRITKKIIVSVAGPLFWPVEAAYLVSEDGRTAFIEMAQASGLALLKPTEYDPLHTTTFGTGQLIKEAIQQGVSKIILGIGGSATNDGGTGMAAALGYRFLDAAGNELQPVGENLERICTIDAAAKTDLKNVVIEAATDVTNLLTGDAGAAKIYGAQKGATPAVIQQLENGMQHFAALAKKQRGIDATTIKGGGAAGGLGAGCVLFLNAKLISGVQLLLQYSNAEKFIAKANLVITGEGRLDAQTAQGKAVSGVVALSKKYGKPVVALCGAVDVDLKHVYESGLTAAFSIVPGPTTLEAAMQQTEKLLEDAAFNVGNFFKSACRFTKDR